MQEKEVITKLALLKKIKPRKDWAVLSRNKIINVELEPLKLKNQRKFLDIVHFFRYIRYIEKPAVAIPLLAILVVGGIAIEQTGSSVPGDILYPVRTSLEQTQRFDSIELAQFRLADLREVVEANRVKNLPSTIREFEVSIEKASQSLTELVENEPEKALQVGREIVQLQKEKLVIEQILGTKIGEDQEAEFINSARKVVEYELAYLETRSLTEEQEELFESAKTSAEQEDYSTALETIWTLSQNP